MFNKFTSQLVVMYSKILRRNCKVISLVYFIEHKKGTTYFMNYKKSRNDFAINIKRIIILQITVLNILLFS